jgi:hypothetical protein
VVEQGVGGERTELGDRPGRTAAAVRQVVTHDQLEDRLDRLEQLLELQGDHAPLLTELDDVPVELVGDAPQHLCTLQCQRDVAQGDLVLELARREQVDDLVEAGR